MNTLSWFLYASEVIPSTAQLVNNISLFTFAGLVLFYSVFIMYIYSELREDKRGEALKALYPFKKYIVLSLFILVAVQLTPSKETIYLIAGSEAGEYVVETEAGKAILSDIQEIIKLQLEGMKQ
ncbi:MAG: hypothetical protein COA78_17505 [Blastopirellula sp.]|nr:MAG: hypothetical protein COA78_17505 [Blastopirellula sp.]